MFAARKGGGGGSLMLQDFVILQLFICKFKKMMFRKKKWRGGGWPLPNATCLIVMSNFAKKGGGKKCVCVCVGGGR